MNGRPGKTTFVDNFSSCNRLFPDKASFTPYSLDALRRDDFSKTVHQRRSPNDRNQLTGLASAALSAFLPQQQTLSDKSSFLSSIRFGGSLDQQSAQHSSFRHHHFLGNGGRFPFILRHRQAPADILSGVGKSDELHQRRRDPHRRHFKNRQSHSFIGGDRFQRSLSPGQNAAAAVAARKRSYRDLDAPDPVQAKLDRRRLVSYADIVCPNDDEPISRSRWNRRRRRSSSNERAPTKQQVNVTPAAADAVQPQPEVTEQQQQQQQPCKEQNETDTKEPSERPAAVESPDEEDEFEQNLKAELERVKGNDGRKQERQDKPLNADQILKHLTRNSEQPGPMAALCNGTTSDSLVTAAAAAEDRRMSVDLAEEHSNAADEQNQATMADPSLLSKRLAAEHRLVVRQTPFGHYECNRDFRRRLRREYQQVLGCSRMPKPLSNFQTFSVLMELADLHLNNGKPSTSADDEPMSLLMADNKNEANVIIDNIPPRVNSTNNNSVSAGTTATTADLLGYMKCILQQTSNNPLSSFGTPAGTAAVANNMMPLQHMLATTGLQMPPMATQPSPTVALPFDFRPCVPPPNYRPQQQAFQQFASSPAASFGGRLPPLLTAAFQQNRLIAPSVDLPRLLRSEQFANALLQLSAAAAASADRHFGAGNSVGVGGSASVASGQIAASMANSFLAASQNSLLYRNRRHVLNPMSEVVREAQEFVRSRLASSSNSTVAQASPPVVDLKPIPNVIGPLGNAFTSNQQWPLPGSPSLTQDELVNLVNSGAGGGGGGGNRK